MECGFYKLQKALRKEGWYVEWKEASQGSHVWEDMPMSHQEGPFEGIDIDEGKCLLTFVDEQDLFYSYLHDGLPRPDGLSDDEWDAIRDDLIESLSFEGDLEPLTDFLGGEERWLSFIDGLPDPTPEGLGGNYFMLCLWRDDALENLKAVLPIFESCGCSYSNLTKDGVLIEWGSE